MTFSPVEIAVNLIIWAMENLGLPGLIALMAVESFGLPPLPSEVILPFAGFLIATGVFLPVPAVLAALAGGVLGSYVAYLVGRYGRHLLTGGPRYLRIDPKQLDAMDRWFQRHGEGTVLFSRLLPVVRSYVSYPAGTARMEPVRFGVYTLIGATPFTLALMYAGYLLGQNWSAVLPVFHLLDDVVYVVLAIGVVYLLLRWRHVVTPGWPPRLTRSSGPTAPAGGEPPSPTAKGSPPL